MRRLIAGGVAAVLACWLALLAPVAQASSLSRSVSCSMFVAMKFKPALQEGANSNEFIALKFKLEGCSGGGVTTARGRGGSVGTFRCHDGRLSGSAIAKARIDWNTGDSSGLNFIFRFSRSLFRGEVVSGEFLNEHVKSTFTLTAVKGDCSSSPMIRAQLHGTFEA
jgi:hypothetical protein